MKEKELTCPYFYDTSIYLSYKHYTRDMYRENNLKSNHISTYIQKFTRYKNCILILLLALNILLINTNNEIKIHIYIKYVC